MREFLKINNKKSINSKKRQKLGSKEQGITKFRREKKISPLRKNMEIKWKAVFSILVT